MTDYFDARLDLLVQEKMLALVSTVAGLVFLLVVGWVVTLAIGYLFRRLDTLARALAARGTDPVEHEKRLLTVFSLLRAGLLTLWWAAVAVMILSQVGVNVTPVLAGAGIVGLAVGFGAQNLVRDVITGFFHIMENQVRIGDVVKINGVGGLVERITYRIIVIRDLEQVVHVFPHGKVESLANLTKDWSAAVIDIGVAYKEDPDRVMAALREIGAAMHAEPAWSDRMIEPLDVLGVEAFADSAVIIRTRCKTRPLQQWDVAREFRRRVKQGFDARGIEFPFPHRTLVFGQGAALAVKALPTPPAPAAG